MSTQSKEALEPVYRCWQGHASPAGVVPRGATMRGDDPRVTAAPKYFVLDEVPVSEEPSAWDAIVEADEAREAERQAELERQARANRVKLAAPALPVLLRSTRDVIAHEAGRPALLSKGSILLADDPRVRLEPDAWAEFDA